LFIEQNNNANLKVNFSFRRGNAMSEKRCNSCASQQEKEKKANNSGTKHSKKTHKKD
jgi:hypothetical protein